MDAKGCAIRTKMMLHWLMRLIVRARLQVLPGMCEALAPNTFLLDHAECACQVAGSGSPHYISWQECIARSLTAQRVMHLRGLSGDAGVVSPGCRIGPS
eukprot:1810403-Amphidinium_carterae.1